MYRSINWVCLGGNSKPRATLFIGHRYRPLRIAEGTRNRFNFLIGEGPRSFELHPIAIMITDNNFNPGGAHLQVFAEGIALPHEHADIQGNQKFGFYFPRRPTYFNAGRRGYSAAILIWRMEQVVEDEKSISVHLVASAISIHQEQLPDYGAKFFFAPEDAAELKRWMVQVLVGNLAAQPYAYKQNLTRFAHDFINIVGGGPKWGDAAILVIWPKLKRFVFDVLVAFWERESIYWILRHHPALDHHHIVNSIIA